ncbi:MAG: MATE family efflux transporter [Filifactoraceae bacterium]
MKKKFLNYMIPSVFAMWIFSLYTMVDGMFVAWGVGSMGLAGVNIAMPYINFIFAFSLLFATAVSTSVAIAFGKGEKEKANRLFSMNTIFLLIISILFTLLTFIFMDKVCKFLGASSETLKYVKTYLSIISLFNWAFILSYNFEVLVKVDGFPRLATVGVLASALTNVVLDYIFIMIFNWGVAGAAWATGISQVVAVLIFTIHFMGKKASLLFVKFPINLLRVYKDILPIGVSDSITEFSVGLTTFIFNTTILRYIGDSGIVSFTVISYFNTIVLMTMIGITQGMQPLVSYHYGSGERHIYIQFLRYAVISVVATSVALFFLAFFGTYDIVALFISTKEIDLINETVKAMKIFSWTFLIMGFNVIISGYFVAITKAKYAMIIATCRGFLFLWIIVKLLTGIWGTGGIWISAFVSETLCLMVSLFLMIRFRKNYVNIR